MRLKESVKLSIKLMEKHSESAIKKEFRCSARYNFSDADDNNTWCPERVSCMRYRTVTNGLDAAVGIESYQGINYFMAIKDCKSKIEMVGK